MACEMGHVHGEFGERNTKLVNSQSKRIDPPTCLIFNVIELALTGEFAAENSIMFNGSPLIS